MVDKTNSRRFINAFNQIDYSLRTQHNFKRSMGFSDMIRRACSINHIVRKYEELLIDFSRLRNAIVHGSTGEITIAEPHDDIVEKIEHLARLISTPPKAIDVLSEKVVMIVNYDLPVKEVIKTINSTSFSNLPVYKNGELIGVANGQKILDFMGKWLNDGKDIDKFLNDVKIEQLISQSVDNRYYTIMCSDVTIDQVLAEFLANRKLLVVIMTKTGTMNEPPLAIITSTDYMELDKILEKY